MSSRECVICYNDYDELDHKPCIGTCGHSICLTCRNLMATSKCPHCNRDDAFSVLTINYQTIEVLKQLKALHLESPSASLIPRVKPREISDEGVCSACGLNVRKLRICVKCAKQKNFLVQNGSDIRLNTKDFTIEQSIGNAAAIALCGDCVLDGEHEGHKLIQFSELRKDIDSLHLQTITNKIAEVKEEAYVSTENLKHEIEAAFAKLSEYHKLGEVLQELDKKTHFSNVEITLEMFRNSVAMIQDGLKRFELTGNEVAAQIAFVTQNSKPFSRKAVILATLDPVLIADRKQSVKDPLLIGVFDPKNETWLSVGRMPTLKSNYAVASLVNKIFIVGGMNNGQWLNSLEMYDRDKNLRKEGNRMTRGRTRTSAGIHNGKLIVAGGYDGNYMDSVEIYDPETNEWKDGPSLKRPRADCMIVSCHGDLYVVGGFNGKDYEEQIEKLNEERNEFEVRGDMNGSRAGFGSCAFKGRIYIAGGWSSSNNTLKTVKSYDPLTNTWRDETSMTRDRKYFTLHATTDAVYAIRGCADSWTQIAEIEKLNTTTNKWEVIQCQSGPSQFAATASSSTTTNLANAPTSQMMAAQKTTVVNPNENC